VKIIKILDKFSKKRHIVFFKVVNIRSTHSYSPTLKELLTISITAIPVPLSIIRADVTHLRGKEFKYISTSFLLKIDFPTHIFLSA